MNRYVQALIVVVTLAVSVGGGWVLTSMALRFAGRSPDAGSADVSNHEDTPHDDAVRAMADQEPERRSVPATVSDGPDGPRARAVLRGGTWIGILERIAVTAAVLAGYPAGIAFVIAIKGLGRYPELRENPGASERFVIGTLASFVWAAAVGMGGRALLG